MRHYTLGGRRMWRLFSVYSCSGRFETEATDEGNVGCVAACTNVILVAGDVVALPVLECVLCASKNISELVPAAWQIDFESCASLKTR